MKRNMTPLPCSAAVRVVAEAAKRSANATRGRLIVVQDFDPRSKDSAIATLICFALLDHPEHKLKYKHSLSGVHHFVKL